ncbi:hypothetical protein [Chryseobacterium sp.]|uniref:hypothetical protein n=1 Tax=Chryseobacterium sp. TaxID=1871047 RepID=UPI00289D0342|nr:hypothetical protein [Chryseobacterium sp.]
MKKLFLVATLGVVGLMSAKANTNLYYSSSEYTNQGNYTSSLSLLRYDYLYQSTCGTYFTMTSEVSITDMTDSQYKEYWDSVVAANDENCSNPPGNGGGGFVLNDKK